jgi:hypothetical protein
MIFRKPLKHDFLPKLLDPYALIRVRARESGGSNSHANSEPSPT